MRKSLLFAMAILSISFICSCGSEGEKEVPKTEQELMEELSKTMDIQSSDMSIDTTSKDSVLLK